MKKFFLPILAALGMTLGLTLTSCGGGGGSEKAGEPARALVGTSINVTSGTPSFQLDFQTANTGWIVSSEFSPGAQSTYPCSFSLMRQPELVDGCWEIWGRLGWVDISVFQDNNFLALIGANQAAASCVVDNFVLVLQIPAGEQSGYYAGRGQLTVTGRYFMRNDDPEGTKIVEDPREIEYEMTGKLKAEYLAPPVQEEVEDDPFDY